MVGWLTAGKSILNWEFSISTAGRVRHMSEPPRHDRCCPIYPNTKTLPCPGMYRIYAEVLRKEKPLRIPRAAPLLQPERGRARRRGLIRTLANTFRNDIRDQEVRIN